MRPSADRGRVTAAWVKVLERAHKHKAPSSLSRLRLLLYLVFHQHLEINPYPFSFYKTPNTFKNIYPSPATLSSYPRPVPTTSATTFNPSNPLHYTNGPCSRIFLLRPHHLY